LHPVILLEGGFCVVSWQIQPQGERIFCQPFASFPKKRRGGLPSSRRLPQVLAAGARRGMKGGVEPPPR